MENTARLLHLLPTPLRLHHPLQYSRFLCNKAQLCTRHSLHPILLHRMTKLPFHPFHSIVLELMMPRALLLGGQRENPGGKAKPKKSKFRIQNIDISCTAVAINLLNFVLMMLEIPLLTVTVQMYYDT